MSKGKIVQVMGPVVDVVFEDGDLPDIKDALEVENNGKKCVMEVSQHLGNDVGSMHHAECQRGTSERQRSNCYRKWNQSSCR